MVETPSLISLCLDKIKEQLLSGDDDHVIEYVYELPSELFDCLLLLLTPLALENLQQHMPIHACGDYGLANGNSGIQRKRKRWLNFETAWKALYEARWRSLTTHSSSVNLLTKQDEVKDAMTDDWQQMYWERHMQNCLDEAAEIALVPSYDGSIGMLEIPVAILNSIGCRQPRRKSTCGYTKFSDHWQHFGVYARCLRLHSALCVPEICYLLRKSMLERLEILWIKSVEQVDGLCKLLKQNVETLKSIEFIHCKLSTPFVNTICDSLRVEGLNTHRIQHFSIKMSNFLETNSFPLPIGLASFCIIREITGWLSHLKWRSRNGKQLSFGIGKGLESLQVLNLRNNNLQRDDAECLQHALVHMPKLETLDLSDNPIEDDGIRSMIPYFAEMSEKQFPLVDLKLGNCELTCNGVSQLYEPCQLGRSHSAPFLLEKTTLEVYLRFSKMGALLGKFLHKGIQVLDIEDIGLGSFGFQDTQKEIMGNLMLVYINISKNRGGIETSKFLSKLISCAPELVAINAGYNFMPAESLSAICSTLKAVKGKVEHLDLTGNPLCERAAESFLAEYKINGNCILKFGTSHALTAPYDDDP